MSYNKGYQKGFSDGKSGKNKVNISHFLKGLTSISPGEFSKGYEEGYRKGSEARNKK